MSLTEELVLPRPGDESCASKAPIPGPTEQAFTETFGALLPSATYIETIHGRAAYYELIPLEPAGESPAASDRILLIHGVQTPALGLLPLARALQASFPHAHLVLFDLWGHGLSDTPIKPHEQSLFHHLIDALLDRLQWPSVHLIGFSFGGALTPEYATSRPSRVQSFTLIAPAGLMRLSHLDAVGQGHVHGGGDEIAARRWIHRWLDGGDPAVPTDWQERVAEGQIVAPALRSWQLTEHGGHAASVVAMIRDGGVFDRHAAFSKVAESGIPSLAIIGELDDICSAQDLRAVGFTNVTTITQVGHEVVRERAPEVAASIKLFWDSLDDKPT